MNWRTTTVAFATGLLGMCPTWSAQAANFSVGAGVGAAPDYEGSEDYEVVPMWNLKATNLWGKPTYVQLLNTKLRSNFLDHPNWRLGLSGEYVAERHNVENDQVDALDDAEASVMLGALAGYDMTVGNGAVLGFEVNARYDVANSNGYLITPAVAYTIPVANNSWIIATKVSTTWASEDYMSNYFGINAANAASSGLDQFDADAGFKDASLELSATWRLSDRWSLTGLGVYKRLLGDASDSPITDDVGNENQFLAGVLVNFRL